MGDELFSTLKPLLKFLEHIMRKESLENLILTGQIGGKSARRKQSVAYLMGLNKWMVEKCLGGI